ncbi:fibrous sheath-interacting protein 2-like [Lissotriton helveticus]
MNGNGAGANGRSVDDLKRRMYMECMDKRHALLLDTDEGIIGDTGIRKLLNYNKQHSSVINILEQQPTERISNWDYWNTNNSNVKQYLQAQLDIQQVVNSVYHNISQRYETPAAMQAALVSCSGALFDRIANTIIIEMTHHLQSLLSGEAQTKPCPSSSTGTVVEEVLGDITVHCKRSPPGKQNKDTSTIPIYFAEFLEDVISGLLSKIVFSSSFVDSKGEVISKCGLIETAAKLVHPLLGEIKKSPIKIVNSNKETCSSLPSEKDVNGAVHSIYHCILKEFGSYQKVQMILTCNSKGFIERISSLLLAGLDDYQIQPPLSRDSGPCKALEASNIIKKIRTKFRQSKTQDRPLSPLTTMLSAKVFEDIVIRLISKMFPASSSAQCAGNPSSLTDSEFKEMISKLIHEVMMEISNHEILYTQDATYIQCVHAQKDAPNVVDSVYNNIMGKYGNQIAAQDLTSEGQNMVKGISRLLIREISNPNFMAVQSVESSCSYASASASAPCVVEHILCGIDVSWDQSQTTNQNGVSSTSFLQDIITGIISKIFCAIVNQIMQGEDKIASAAKLCELTVTIVNSVLLEIKNAQTPMPTIVEEKNMCPETRKSAVNTIVNSVFCTMFRENDSGSTFYVRLTHSSSSFAKRIVCLISAAIVEDQSQRPVTEDAASPACVTLDAENIVKTVVTNVTEAKNQGKCPMVRIPSTTSVKAASVVETVFDYLAQPFDDSYLSQQSVTVLSSRVLEEIVAHFVSKLFINCPNLALCTKDISSISHVKEITERLLNALLINIPEEQIQIVQDTSEIRYVHPNDYQIIEKVVNSVYSSVFQLSGSHLSIYCHLARKGDALSQTVANLMIAEICNYHFEPCCPRGKLLDKYVSIELSYIVQRVLNDIRGMPAHSPLIESNSHGLYTPFLEEIVSQFLTKMFVSSNYARSKKCRSNSLESELSIIASKLINTVLKEMVRNEMCVIKPVDEENCLHPEDEDFISEVVDSVYMNALHEAGSPFNLFKGITSGSAVVSERIASLVIKEIFKYQLLICSAAGVSCDAYTDMEVTKIVEKVLTHVIAQSTLAANAEQIVDSITDKIKDSLEDELPKIIPHVKSEPVKIDPVMVAEHLAVLSIKTEYFDLLKKQCLLQSGHTLEYIRNIAFYDKSTSENTIEAAPLVPDFAVLKKQRVATLDTIGRIAVKPKQVNNSFINLYFNNE